MQSTFEITFGTLYMNINIKQTSDEILRVKHEMLQIDIAHSHDDRIIKELEKRVRWCAVLDLKLEISYTLNLKTVWNTSLDYVGNSYNQELPIY